jgi:hypothetical protein
MATTPTSGAQTRARKALLARLDSPARHALESAIDEAKAARRAARHAASAAAKASSVASSSRKPRNTPSGVDRLETSNRDIVCAFLAAAMHHDTHVLRDEYACNVGLIGCSAASKPTGPILFRHTCQPHPSCPHGWMRPNHCRVDDDCGCRGCTQGFGVCLCEPHHHRRHGLYGNGYLVGLHAMQSPC